MDSKGTQPWRVTGVNEVAEANEEFSKILFSQMKKNAADEANLLLSPFSAITVLSMAASGAGGKTEKQMVSGLHLLDLTSAVRGFKEIFESLELNENFTLLFANAAFVSKDCYILSEFKEKIHDNFNADVREVTFKKNEEAAASINDWVKSMTKEKIKDLVCKDSINENTRLIL